MRNKRLQKTLMKMMMTKMLVSSLQLQSADPAPRLADRDQARILILVLLWPRLLCSLSSSAPLSSFGSSERNYAWQTSSEGAPTGSVDAASVAMPQSSRRSARTIAPLLQSRLRRARLNPTCPLLRRSDRRLTIKRPIATPSSWQVILEKSTRS